jgi:hypothetical protein
MADDDGQWPLGRWWEGRQGIALSSPSTVMAGATAMILIRAQMGLVGVWSFSTAGSTPMIYGGFWVRLASRGHLVLHARAWWWWPTLSSELVGRFV